MDWMEELKNMKVEERTKLVWNDPKLSNVAEAVEKKYQLPEGLIRAIKYAENKGSKNDSTARSGKSAEGIMQFMPNTRKLQNGLFDHNVLDPVESIDAAGRYLQFTLKNQYKGNVIAAIADYNGGPSQGKRVLKGEKPNIKETDDYLKKTQEFFLTLQPQSR